MFYTHHHPAVFQENQHEVYSIFIYVCVGSLRLYEEAK